MLVSANSRRSSEACAKPLEFTAARIAFRINSGDRLLSGSTPSQRARGKKRPPTLVTVEGGFLKLDARPSIEERIQRVALEMAEELGDFSSEGEYGSPFATLEAKAAEIGDRIMRELTRIRVQ